MKYYGIPMLFGTDIIYGYDVTYPVLITIHIGQLRERRILPGTTCLTESLEQGGG